MIIMCSVDHLLNRSLESVLALEFTSLDTLRNIIQRPYHIHRRLLVARGRILQVCERALKLEGIIVITQKFLGDSRVEGGAEETVVGKHGREKPVCW